VHLRRGRFGLVRLLRFVEKFDQIVFAPDRGFQRDAGERGGGSLSPGRYSLALGIPVLHYVEAIGGTANIARLGYIVEKTGESQRILPHAVTQRFEVSSSCALVAPTEGSTKPTTVTVTNAGIATVLQYDLRMP